MFYPNSAALEKAMFGVSSGRDLFYRFGSGGADFDTDLKLLIIVPGPSCPDTVLGQSLFGQTKRELDQLGISTEGFIFRSAVDTKLDLRHFTDGFFHLPVAYRFPVTIDLFNINDKSLLNLKSFWIDQFDGDYYSWQNFQTDLFQYKVGMFEWRKEHQIPRGFFLPPDFIDFRKYANCGRPENQLILTPYDMANYERRKFFAKMVARYLASKVPGHEMAEQSH